MTYSKDTAIAGKSHGTAQFFIDKATNEWHVLRLDEFKRYAIEGERLCSLAGIRYEIMMGQFAVETGNKLDGTPGQSYWWDKRLNPAGIGITGDPTQDAASKTFASGKDAARAHVVHLYLYAKGAVLPEGLESDWDPRWSAALGATPSRAGIAPTLAGLNGMWAADKDYANKIASRINGFGELPDFSVPAENPTPVTPKPEYAPIVKIPQLDQYRLPQYANTAPALVTAEGSNYIYLSDIVEAKRDTPRLQRAVAGAKRVGKDIKAGEQARAVWRFTAKDGRDYYLFSGWSRSLAKDFVRVKDVN